MRVPKLVTLGQIGLILIKLGGYIYIHIHTPKILGVPLTSVVTVSLFSRSVGVSVKKAMVGLGFGVYMCVPSATTYSLALWA